MNILIFSWRGPKHPLAGGAEQVTLEHAKAWIKAGHTVYWFSSSFGEAKREEFVSGIKIIRSGRQYLDVQFRAFLWYLLDKHPNFDLVVDQFHGIPFFTPIYVRTIKLAVLQEVAREVWLKNHLPKPFNWIVGVVGYLGEPLIFLFYRKVPFMVGSDSAKKDLVRFGIPKKNIFIVLHGVIIKKLKTPLKKEKKKTVIFLGALSQDKGIEDALRTFSILNKVGVFNFWVAGRVSKQYMTYLKKMVFDLGLAGKVKFWGFVSQEKKFELLASSHVMINPSIREGWSLVNIEANAMGTPVVGYDVAGLRDSIVHKKTGLLTSSRNPSALAENILRLFQDKGFYRLLQKGAISWSKKFTWEESVKKSLKLIESL